MVGHHKEALGIAEGGKEEGVDNNEALLQGIAATEWHVEVKARAIESSWSGLVKTSDTITSRPNGMPRYIIAVFEQ